MTDKNLWSFFGSLSLYSSPSSRWLLYYYHLLRGTVFKRTRHFCFPLSKPSKIGKCQTPWITGCEKTEAGTFLATRYTIPYTTRIHRAKSQNIFPLSSFLFFLLHLFLFFFFEGSCICRLGMSAVAAASGEMTYDPLYTILHAHPQVDWPLLCAFTCVPSAK